jgi:hypothetical protein
MAYLPEEKDWGPGVFQIETNTPWVGGLDGNCNKQARELIKRLNYLKDYADELAAARSGKANLDERLDQYDAFNPDSIAALYMLAAMGIDLAGLANREAAKTISQRLQSGVAVVTNRGIISGCTVSKSANAVRNLSLAAGAFFLNGVELSCPAVSNGALVPANDGSAAQSCYAYIFLNANGQVQFATTPFGQAVPDGGLALYRITAPAGNTGENDPYLGSVTLTDVRRIEAGYPIQVNSLPYASVALPYSMIDSDYAVYLDLLSFKGGGNQRAMVYPGDKAGNGFKIYVQGSLDAVSVRWTAVKLSL